MKPFRWLYIVIRKWLIDVWFFVNVPEELQYSEEDIRAENERKRDGEARGFEVVVKDSLE